MAYTQYKGDISGYLGRDLISDDFRGIGSQIGSPELSGGTQFAAGGNVYKVEDTGRGTRRLVSQGSEGQLLQQQQAASRQAMMDRQKAEEDTLVGEFTSKVQGAPTMSQRYGEIGADLGIPDFKKNVQGLGQAVEGLQGTLFNLPEQVKNLKRGFDVNANRLKRITESQSEPIRRDLIEMSRQYGIQSGTLASLEHELGTRLGFEREDFERTLKPILMKAQLVSERLGREFSGFMQDDEQEFNLLLDKIQGDRQLTLAEQQRAHDLAMKEEEYIQARQSDKQFITVGGRIKLVDGQTGAILSDLGSSTAPGSGSGGNYNQYLNTGSTTSGGWSYQDRSKFGNATDFSKQFTPAKPPISSFNSW